ncbi:LppX_LprAFG lipoprotein [Streptomyces polyrhachis]|uniref:LppX_LprAFG lipoprotein n=1 Tax=Streptomyces polyrhachis TaxID=1282885 RepID=A0ABW2GDV4_9ACTN
MKSVIRRKTAAALLAGALLCGGAAACSKDEPKGTSANSQEGGAKPADVSPAAAVDKAVKKGEAIASLTYKIKGTMAEGSMAGDGAVDLKKRVMAMKMKVKAGAEGGGEIEFRLVGEAMYMRVDEQGGTEKWMKFDLGNLPDGQNPLDGMSTAQDPTAGTAGMRAAKDLKKVGEETVEGVETTHYTGTVTLDQLRAELKSDDAKAFDDFGKEGVDKLTMDMWIDGEDNTKQFRMRGDSKKGPLDMTFVFGEINQPVTVEVPPASKVMDLKELSGS